MIFNKMKEGSLKFGIVRPARPHLKAVRHGCLFRHVLCFLATRSYFLSS